MVNDKLQLPSLKKFTWCTCLLHTTWNASSCQSVCTSQSVTPIDGSPIVPSTASSPPHCARHAHIPEGSSLGLWSVVVAARCCAQELPCSTVPNPKPSYSSPPSKTRPYSYSPTKSSHLVYDTSLHPLEGITGSNPTESMDIFLMFVVLCR